ncbi:MAG: ribosomal-protein-alanine N-acetyltransferase [Gammaproteobacteria bacterium RIFCSPLOWO2_02_FULL_56_15]|nr:MAG: ribosomal-protein-alanine N-acetyltransferase [Gammaproteobacteria bacterium RIFCSPLOWO2_02_FULL_56_15]HLE81438.1 ribosomal protein S18-alanine N-acetyltransferase [Dehalococcoidia bacterium]
MSAQVNEALPRFRPMVEADIVVILEIEESAYTHPWTETIFSDCLRAGYCCWILEAEGFIIGYGIMTVGAGECHLLNLCVRPAMHRRGIGGRLLEHLTDLAREHHAEVMLLEVRPSNAVARRLYYNNGFNEVGMRRNYYPAGNGREDALIMARSLV